MAKPSAIRLTGSDSDKYIILNDTPAQALDQLRSDVESELAEHVEVRSREDARHYGLVRANVEAAKLAIAEADEVFLRISSNRAGVEDPELEQLGQRVEAETRAAQASEIRALREKDLARLAREKESLENAVAKTIEEKIQKEKLAIDQLNSRLTAERIAMELIQSQAEADRNATLLQEQANVLLRKAEKKSQERLATETMASKAAAFRLQTERELALLAEKRATAELHATREAELRLRAETRGRSSPAATE